MEEKHKCPLCGEYTLDELNVYDYCDNCGWFDDPYQRKNPDYDDGRNDLSFNDAKKAFSRGEKLNQPSK